MLILVLDDEQNIRKTLRMCLETAGHVALTATNMAEAESLCAEQVVDLVFLDMRLGTQDGLNLIPRLVADSPWTKIVVMTAYASVDTAVEAMRRGAHDYVAKPFTPQQIRLIVDRVAELRRLETRVQTLEADAQSQPVGWLLADSRSPAMQRALSLAKRGAAADATLLLGGGSGTGKSVLAREIHGWSRRHGGPFCVVSCPSLSPELLESELFGHVKGAFTGAFRDHPGRVAAAAGGTLFLDEVGDLPAAVQPKLLRFLQDRSYERVGDSKTRHADVRIVAATHQDLEHAVAEGRMREDLFYRLSVFRVDLPGLAERREDIPDLAVAMLAELARDNHRRIAGFTDAAMDWLRSRAWPGNLREFRNTVERAVILCDEGALIDLTHLPDSAANDAPSPAGDRLLSLAELEALHVRKVLQRTASLQEAAQVLGIDQATLWRKRKQLGLD